MFAQELLDGIRVWPRRIGGKQRVEEIQKFFRRARWEGVDRMSHDISMTMLGKVEADRATARARTLGIVIGNGRNSREVEKRTVTGVEFRWI
jgi:hypothetical protein